MNCSSGHANPDGASFCAVCGIALGSPARMPAPTFAALPPAAGFVVGPSYATVAQPVGPAMQNGFGVTSMVLGIVALVTCYFGLILGPLAIIFGTLGLRRCNAGQSNNRGMALSGVITGGVATVIYLLVIAAVVASSDSGY